MYLALLPDIDMFSSWLMLLSATFLCVSSSILARTSACCAAMTCADCCCCCSCCCCNWCCCNCCCCNCCCWSCCCWSCNCCTAAVWTGTAVVVTTGVAGSGATTAVGVPKESNKSLLQSLVLRWCNVGPKCPPQEFDTHSQKLHKHK